MARPVRLAATTLVFADVSSKAFEVLMIKRHAKARFMANVYVFPGGCVDDADQLTASQSLPLFNDGGFRVAAVRELFEETRVRIAGDGTFTTPSLTSSSVCFDPLGAKHLSAFAHWITPKQEKYRYDTWFYATKAPDGFIERSCLEPDLNEVADVRWVSPAKAIAMHEDGTSDAFRLPPPTYLIMKELSLFPNATSVLDHKKDVQSFPAIEPTLKMDEAGVIQEMHLEDAWVPESVVPRVAGTRYRVTHVPIYDPKGQRRLAAVHIGDGKA